MSRWPVKCAKKLISKRICRHRRNRLKQVPGGAETWFQWSHSDYRRLNWYDTIVDHCPQFAYKWLLFRVTNAEQYHGMNFRYIILPAKLFRLKLFCKISNSFITIDILEFESNSNANSLVQHEHIWILFEQFLNSKCPFLSSRTNINMQFQCFSRHLNASLLTNFLKETKFAMHSFLKASTEERTSN